MTVPNFRSFGRSGLGPRSFWALGLGLALMAALPGCVASAEGGFAADYPTEYVETVPPRIEYYPRTYYRGHPAYLVEGRWYYRTQDRWAVFRQEPVELREVRARREPAYLGPSNRSYGRSQERLVAERRAEQHREAERRAEQHREAERRAEENRRGARAEAQRDQEHRHAEQRQQAQRAEEQRRFEQHRDAERRAAEDRRVAERRGRPTRKRDRAHGDQHDTRDERDRHHRQD